MSAIVLPTSPGVVAPTKVRLLDWGGLLDPALGGETQRIDRLGSRHALDVSLPPMPASVAMAWCQRLKRGKNDMVQMRVPQPGFTPQTPVSSVAIGTNAAGGSNSVLLATVASHYQVREGQFFSVIHAGRSYLYGIDADAIDTVDGFLSVTVTPKLRTALTTNDAAEIVNPIIEGYPVGDETSWDVSEAAIYGLTFSIVEPG
jgi:hypothetical protein